jgi:hypothetical protein
VTTPVESATVALYWIRDGQVWPGARQVGDILVEELAISSLLSGPTESEQADLKFETALPTGVEEVDVTVDGEVATVEFEGADELSPEGLAQVVYTETAFAGVNSVEIGGRTYTRADFEDQTPSILVQSPLSFAEVESPFRVRGTANTFEATFNYEVTDTDGKIVDEDFVTATSGSGTRGTFDFTTGDFTVPFDGIGALIVFELSAEDGSRIHLVEIPLTMKK